MQLNRINGRAYVNPDKCVSCGMCMVSCPFGAISDKSQIFQLARALSEGEQIIAEIAPAFTGQFGDNINARNLKAALEELGFSQVYEVAAWCRYRSCCGGTSLCREGCDRRITVPFDILLSVMGNAGKEIFPGYDR